VKELMLSPLVLANTETPTSKLSSELISISRRNQFCSNLNVGIINLATNSGGDIPEFDNGESVCAVGNSVLGASVLPIENFVRGVENDSLPPTSSAVWSMGIERICKQTATTYVNTNALVKATDELSFSINQILTDFLGVPSNHPLYANFSSAMTELYNSARDDGLGNVLARREMFSFVCESPELIGVGL